MPFELPTFPELQDLSEDDRAAIMLVSNKSGKGEVESLLRRAFVFAVVDGASDVHIVGRGARDQPEVTIGIRSSRGFLNMRYPESEESRHFQTKLFQLSNIAQGGTTPDMLSTRFSMAFPTKWATEKGLQVKEGWNKYYVDVRVEYSRTFDGFAFTCRLLDQQRSPPIEKLGLPYALEVTLKRLIQEPSGLILATGPTGSGKTTLLNAILGYLNNGQNSIFTIENPVEFRLHGPGPIKQIEVQGDVTFARALRSALRHDPDIILIGEIRDAETMEIALQAAQTGHLVLATLHANSASDTFSRALDLTQDKRRDAMRLGDTLKFVMAQRLIDQIDGTAQARALSRTELAWLKDNGLAAPDHILERTNGQKVGKRAVIEAIEVDYTIRKLIQAEHLDKDRIYEQASTQLQYETLPMAGMRLAETGEARLSDCMVRLDTEPAAERHLPWRTVLATRYGVGYGLVNAAIEKYLVELDKGNVVTVEQMIEELK